MSLFDKFNELNFETDLGMKHEIKLYFAESKEYASYSLEINNNIFYIKAKLVESDFVLAYVKQLISNFVSYIGYLYFNAYKIMEYEDKFIIEYLTATENNVGVKFILEFL